MPEAATGNQEFTANSLWDMTELMRHLPLCRRSIYNLMRRGLPHIRLGRRLVFHSGSVQGWLLRQQRGGGQ